MTHNSTNSVSGKHVIEEAKALIASSFDGELAENFTEGTIDAALELCRKRGNVIVGPGRLFAYFWYWSAEEKAVEEMSFGDLEEREDDNLGPILHVVAFIAPERGYALFRKAINALNPYGVTAHRYCRRSNEFRFAVAKNVKWRGVEENA